MACNNQNGKTYYNSLTPFPGGTDASTSYLLDATHYTCGNKQMCINSAEGFPLASNFDIQVLGTPRPLGGNLYCCDIRCICDLTYRQVYRCGCGCPNSCLETEKVIVTKCIPCPSADVPTVTAVGVSASPVGSACGCPSTNMADVEFAFTVESGAAAAGE
jgi:hypothetical protein